MAIARPTPGSSELWSQSWSSRVNDHTAEAPQQGGRGVSKRLTLCRDAMPTFRQVFHDQRDVSSGKKTGKLRKN
jgi:hypothetical protein